MSHSLLGSRYSQQVHEVERVFISATHGETAFASESSTPSDNVVPLHCQTWHLASAQSLLADALLRCRRFTSTQEELDGSNINKQVFKVASEWSWYRTIDWTLAAGWYYRIHEMDAMLPRAQRINAAEGDTQKVLASISSLGEALLNQSNRSLKKKAHISARHMQRFSHT